MCNHELKRLFYTKDADYDIQTCRVDSENGKNKYTLCYCKKCGQVFVMEVAEKKNESLEKHTFIKCKECKHHRYDGDIPYCSIMDYGYGWRDEDYCSRAVIREGKEE